MALLTPDWVMPRSAAARTKLLRSATFTKIAKVRRSCMVRNPSLEVIDEITKSLIIRPRPKRKFLLMRDDGAHEQKERAMSSAHTITSVPAVRYRDSGRGGRSGANHELLIAAGLLLEVVLVGTAFFFAFAPAIVDLGSLNVTVT